MSDPILEALTDGRLHVGDFRIIDLSDGSFWIKNTGGEGMCVSSKQFEECIAEFFGKHF